MKCMMFVSLDKMRITYSEPKENLVISGKGLITSLSIKARARSKKWKNSRYAIGNVSKKDLSKNIKDFDKLPYKNYERRRHKHDPTENYFYLTRHLVKCMMRADALNTHIYPVRTEMTATKHILISHIFSRMRLN